MKRALLFVLLVLCHWAPWMLGTIMDVRLASVLGAAAFVAALVLAVTSTPRGERASWGLLPRSPAERIALIGFACGAVAYALVFAARATAAGVELTPLDVNDGRRVVLTGIAVAGYQAFSEEVVFRSAVFVLLAHRLRLPQAVTLSVALFLAAHLPRWESLISGPYALHLILAGAAFAIAYVRTGTIWLGFGMHFGWNLGAYLLLEGSPRFADLAGDLPTGWLGWSSWLGVAGNAVLLALTLALTRPARVRQPTAVSAGR